MMSSDSFTVMVQLNNLKLDTPLVVTTAVLDVVYNATEWMTLPTRTGAQK